VVFSSYAINTGIDVFCQEFAIWLAPCFQEKESMAGRLV
jgi:hypothetical protein